MKKWIFLWLLIGVMQCLSAIGKPADTDTLKYRISLQDKAHTRYSLNQPEAFLSVKALERRVRQQIKIDSTDLPVSEFYVDAIRKKGVKVVVQGKWDNFVTVTCNNPAIMDEIKNFPFVKEIKLVWRAPHSEEEKRDSLINKTRKKGDAYYGVGYNQIKIHEGDKLHAAGFKGKGMTIAVIDGGYNNLDVIQALDNIHVIGMKDFVYPHGNLYEKVAHGLMVLSCMATNKPGVMVGTAPEASYLLLRSEDNLSEQLVEQDYWAAAVEYADSLGIDIVNTSLGYNSFDISTDDYKLHNLNGKYALISRQASRMADKGMILVCSAGNLGGGTWKKITPPGDAFDVLTVGAVDKQGFLAEFSSVGTTADGRIKPDIVALGKVSMCVLSNGNIGPVNGTSFASPTICGLVACLWQACPTLTAKQLMELVRQSGDCKDYPNNVFGYGIPNVWQAYQNYLQMQEKSS